LDEGKLYEISDQKKKELVELQILLKEQSNSVPFLNICRNNIGFVIPKVLNHFQRNRKFDRKAKELSLVTRKPRNERNGF